MQYRAGSNQNRASTTWWNSPLLTKDLTFSKHKAVVAVFGQQFIKTNIFDHKFHKYLVEAFEQRQIGDYEPLEEITKEIAQKNIERAVEFLDAVKDYLAE